MYKYNIHEDGITKVTAGRRLHTCNGLQFFLSTSNIAYEFTTGMKIMNQQTTYSKTKQYLTAIDPSKVKSILSGLPVLNTGKPAKAIAKYYCDSNFNKKIFYSPPEGTKWREIDKATFDRICDRFFQNVDTGELYGIPASEFKAAEKLSPCIWKEISKKEFENLMLENCKKRIQKFEESKKFTEILDIVSPRNNKFSRKAFEEISSVKLPPDMKKTREQIIAYYGNKYAEYAQKKAQEAEKERLAKHNAQQLAYDNEIKNVTTEIKSGNWISNTSFLRLLDHYKIAIPLKTRGWIIHKVVEINCKKWQYRANTKSKRIGELIGKLMKSMN